MIKVMAVLLLFIFPISYTAAESLPSELQTVTAVEYPGGAIRNLQPIYAVAAATPTDSSTTVMPERKAQGEATGGGGCDFFRIHFGGYRWLWWVGGAAVLVGIHLAATD